MTPDRTTPHPQVKAYSPSVFYRNREIERDQILVNPFRAPSSLLFIKAVTIWRIWPSVTFFTAFATIVFIIHRQVPSVQLSSVTLTALGTLIGFVVSYRTSSAYERYTDGRKQWSSIITGARTLARLIWIHCPNAPRPVDLANPPSEEERINAMLEKKTVINLIEAFAVSLKHYLRGEHGIYYEDLYHLACFLPKYAFPTGYARGVASPDLGFTVSSCPPRSPAGLQAVDQVLDEAGANGQTEIGPKDMTIDLEANGYRKSAQTDSHAPIFEDPTRSPSGMPTSTPNPFQPDHELLPAYNPPKRRFIEFFPFLSLFRSVWKGTQNVTGLRRRKGVYERIIHEDNVPLEIILYMDSYIALLKHRRVLDVPTANVLLNSIQTFTDALTTLERILTTPIPFGYLVHLKLVIWGYLFFLPFQLVELFGYATIPAVALIATAFLGFLMVGEEIENPFGYDPNDLDMDYFCHYIIAPELAEITAWPAPDPTDFVFSPGNLPLLGQRELRSGASLLASGVSSNELQRMLHTRCHRGSDASISRVKP